MQQPNRLGHNLSTLTPLAVIFLALSSTAISNGISIYKTGPDATLADK